MRNISSRLDDGLHYMFRAPFRHGVSIIMTQLWSKLKMPLNRAVRKRVQK